MTGGGVASVLGVAGALAVAAPALYIAYQSSSTGQSASSIAKVRSFIDIYIKPAKKPGFMLFGRHSIYNAVQKLWVQAAF